MDAVLYGIFATFATGMLGIIFAGLSIILVFLGLIRGDPGLTMAGGLMMLPITYVSGGWSGWFLVIRLMPLFVFLAAFFVSQQEMLIAWVVPAPAVAYVGFRLLQQILEGLRAFQATL